VLGIVYTKRLNEVTTVFSKILKTAFINADTDKACVVNALY